MEFLTMPEFWTGVSAVLVVVFPAFGVQFKIGAKVAGELIKLLDATNDDNTSIKVKADKLGLVAAQKAIEKHVDFK